MKNSTIEKIKNSKPFQKHDILVYAVLILFVVVLFFSFTFKKNSPATSFNVTLNGTKVLSYTFSTSSLDVENAFADLVELTNEGDLITIKIYSGDNKERFNTLEINKKTHTVDVIDANCSSSKECVHMPKISGSGAIICAPHSLSITCGFLPPVVG